MRILWLKSDLLLPLDKGGKLRTWHLMRHLAQRHEITYLAFTEPGQPAADVDGMREVAARVETVTRSEPAKGTLALLRRRGDAPRRSAAVRRRQVPLARVQAAARRAAGRRSRSISIVCDFLFPAVNLPSGCPARPCIFTHNVESEIWRRHAETQDRRDRHGALRHAVPADAAVRSDRRSRASTACSPSPTPTATPSRPSIPAPSASRCTSSRPASTPTTSRRRRADPASRTLVFTGSMDWLPNEDAMQYLLPRHPAAHPRRGARRHAVDRRPRADAGGAAARRRARRHRHRPGRRCAAVHGGGGGLHRAAAHRRRHAAEDLRSDGDGQGRRLDDGRRRRAAGHRRRRTCCSPTSRSRSRAPSSACSATPAPRTRLETAAARRWSSNSYDWSAVAGALEDRAAAVRPSTGSGRALRFAYPLVLSLSKHEPRSQLS